MRATEPGSVPGTRGGIGCGPGRPLYELLRAPFARCQAVSHGERATSAPRRCTGAAVARVRGTHRITADVCVRHALRTVDRPRLVREWLAAGGTRALTASPWGRPSPSATHREDAACLVDDHRRVPAEAASVALVRNVLSRLLRATDVGDDLRERVLLATSEAVSNAVEHGSAEHGEIDMGLEVRADRMTVAVSDAGRPGSSMPSAALDTPAADHTRGRGAFIMHALAQLVEVRSDSRGTRVLLRFSRVEG